MEGLQLNQQLAINPEVLNQTFDTGWAWFSREQIQSNCTSVTEINPVHTSPELARKVGYGDVIAPGNQIAGRALTLVHAKAKEMKLITGIPIHRRNSWTSRTDLEVGRSFMVKFKITKARLAPGGTILFVKLNAYNETGDRFAFGDAVYFVMPLAEGHVQDKIA